MLTICVSSRLGPLVCLICSLYHHHQNSYFRGFYYQRKGDISLLEEDDKSYLLSHLFFLGSAAIVPFFHYGTTEFLWERPSSARWRDTRPESGLDYTTCMWWLIQGKVYDTDSPASQGEESMSLLNLYKRNFSLPQKLLVNKSDLGLLVSILPLL